MHGRLDLGDLRRICHLSAQGVAHIEGVDHAIRVGGNPGHVHVQSKIGERQLRPEDIAVLVLENKQAAKVQEALREFNIPSVLHTTASLFESHEAAELYRVLAGIALPGDERLVKSALATDLFGVDGSQLAECTEAQWQQWLQLFHDYGEFWSRHGFFRMFRHWLQRQQVRQRVLAFPDGERRLTNILHLGEVLHQAEPRLEMPPLVFIGS